MGEEIKEKIWAGRRSSRLVWGLRPKLIYIIRNATDKKDEDGVAVVLERIASII